MYTALKTPLMVQYRLFPVFVNLSEFLNKYLIGNGKVSNLLDGWVIHDWMEGCLEKGFLRLVAAVKPYF